VAPSALGRKLLKVAHLYKEHKFFSLQKLVSMKKTVLWIRIQLFYLNAVPDPDPGQAL
jgi:hypothetical protein